MARQVVRVRQSRWQGLSSFHPARAKDAVHVPETPLLRIRTAFSPSAPSADLHKPEHHRSWRMCRKPSRGDSS